MNRTHNSLVLGMAVLATTVTTVFSARTVQAGAIAYAELSVTNSQFRDYTNAVVGAQLIEGVDVQVNSLNITTTNVAFHDQLGVDFNTDPVFGIANIGMESDAALACVGNCPGENDFTQGNPLTDGPRVRGDSLATGKTPTTASVLDLTSNGTGGANEDVSDFFTVAEGILTADSNGNASGTIQGNSTVTGVFMGPGSTRDVLFTGLFDFLVYAELHPDALSGNAQANVNLNLRITNTSTGAVIINSNVLAEQAGTGVPNSIDSTSGGPIQFAIPITVPLGVPLNVSLTQSSTISVDVTKIPEPSSCALAGLGVTLVVGYVARRRAA